jgi:tRNA A22 N-methylase
MPACSAANVRLSPRLETILGCIVPELPLWDIGCDHGHLGRAALERELCPEVHLVDRSPRVIAALRAVLEPLPEGLRLWETDAAHERLPVTTGTMVLSGIGIWTAIRIITRQFAGAVPAGLRLVFACPVKEELLRLHLAGVGWRLQSEVLLVEHGQVRQVVACGAAGEAISPFWNGGAAAAPRGLMDRYLSERRTYYASRRGSDEALETLRQALAALAGHTPER